MQFSFSSVPHLLHVLTFSRLKGFPFWPGKLMRVNSENNTDIRSYVFTCLACFLTIISYQCSSTIIYHHIRFFGAHDRAWIPLKDVYLYRFVLSWRRLYFFVLSWFDCTTSYCLGSFVLLRIVLASIVLLRIVMDSIIYISLYCLGFWEMPK